MLELAPSTAVVTVVSKSLPSTIQPWFSVARDMRDISQGYLTIDGGPEIATGGPRIVTAGLEIAAGGFEIGTGGPWLCQLGLAKRIILYWPSLAWREVSR